MVGLFVFFNHFTTVSSHWDLSHGKFWLPFPGESQLRQPMMHTGCFIVCVIYPTLTWTTGSLTCAHVN